MITDDADMSLLNSTLLASTDILPLSVPVPSVRDMLDLVVEFVDEDMLLIITSALLVSMIAGDADEDEGNRSTIALLTIDDVELATL